METKAKILKKFQSQYKPEDWRFPLYDQKEWKEGVLKRDFNAGKQGVKLPKGTVVAYQVREPMTHNGETWDSVIILHESLMMPTSLGRKPQNHINYKD